MGVDLSPITAESSSALPLYAPEHDTFRESARRFVEREIAPHVDEWEAAEDFPRELFRTVGEAGFFGMKFAERWGGSGPDHLAQAIWIEELARAGTGGVAADLGAHSDLACLYVSNFGTDDQLERWLVPALRGEIIGALGVTEPGAGSDVAGLQTRAVQEANGDWVIDGAKVFITNGSWADFYVIAAKVDTGAEREHDKLTLFIVDADAPGFERKRMKMLGWRTSHTGELTFNSVRIPDEQRLGGVGRGFYAIMQNFAWERQSMALGAVVAAEKALELAIAYAKEREAFGRPIAKFQVWRHRFADMNTQIAVGRAITEHALRMFCAGGVDGSAPHPDTLREVAMAKLITQRLAFDVADECVQIHGGAGYMMEYAAQRIWRDARLGPIGGGTDEIMREIIAKTYGL